VVEIGEHAATLEAIDQGIREAKSGRTVPLQEVRKRLPQWITNFSSRKERQAISLKSSSTSPKMMPRLRSVSAILYGITSSC
jgi:hypothetical protein